MSIKRKHREEEDAEVDMTPMLDIVFIMLIFFIVTTSFIKEAGFTVNRPDQNTPPPPENQKKQNIIIQIKNNGDIYVNNRMSDIERVEANVEKVLAEISTENVVIDAGFDVEHERFMRVVDQVNAIGGLTINIASKTAE